MDSRHLGHGIGLRPRHFGHLLTHPVSGVDWMEVISEDCFVEGGRAWAVLERVRRDVPVVIHGVAMGIGDSSPTPDDYLDALERVIARVEPTWVSDHLCWGSMDGAHAHELLPIRYDDATLVHVAAKVSRVQDTLGRQLVLENVSRYAHFAGAEHAECDFLNELVRRTGAGLLLDVNNVYVSSRNLGFDPRAYLDRLDARGIVQLHLAGHSDRGDYLMDTHEGPVPEVVWELYRHTVARIGPIPTLVEWDTDVPAFETVVAESERARRIEAEVTDEHTPTPTPDGPRPEAMP